MNNSLTLDTALTLRNSPSKLYFPAHGGYPGHPVVNNGFIWKSWGNYMGSNFKIRKQNEINIGIETLGYFVPNTQLTDSERSVE